jgi:hypothetical protein
MHVPIPLFVCGGPRSALAFHLPQSHMDRSQTHIIRKRLLHVNHIELCNRFHAR